ncbi:protein regulator of cytokinesis 1-like [Sinocyclocheilus anshuiensis]|uniref:Protein regulator of cytokinesis 1-like n=1 Tax=Sinocyclocheilus anshuiensis TaxID=1608454 RepID=A0A671R342_9TELE|nr:PREDICTED: protein regulator of cytokinesis 1-like [Sinocyclocheilus anshuiensis]
MSCRRSEALAFSLVTEINHSMARLVDIWDSIGIMEEQRVERMQTVKKHIDELLHSMIMEEEALRHRIKTDVITFQKQLDTLCLELGLEPYKLEQDLTVLQMEKNLRCHVESLLKEKNERLRELSDLKKQDEDLCVTLCSTPYYIPSGSVPSRTQLQELQEHVEKLIKEKVSREKVFSGLREDIRSLMDEMGHEPESSLERESICPDTDIFLLTHDNIKALKLLLSQLAMKKESLISARDKLKERATSLWNRLSCPEPEGEAFREAAVSTLSDDIRRWQGYVEHLEELQMAQLEEVVDKVRQELVVLWDKCLIGPEQREPFNVHFCDDHYTEELLALHDTELLRMKAFYEAAQPILEDLEKWKRNWALFQEFERKAADPNRFSNRGGSLLKESKDRAKVQKLLPKLEEELRSLVEVWEKNRGTSFLVQGQRIMDCISSQWEEHRLQKDKEKNERMTKKTETSQFKTPTKRPLGSTYTTPTPNKIKKMPNMLAPMRTATMSSVSSSSSSSGCSSTTFLCVPGRPQLSAKRTKTTEASSGPRVPLQEFNSDKKPLPVSYSAFTSELSKKANTDAFLNSTVKDML